MLELIASHPILTAVLAIVIGLVLLSQRTTKSTLPGPKPWPIIGSLPLVYPYMRHEQGWRMGEILNATYGNIFEIRIFSRREVVVCDADQAKRILAGTAAGDLSKAEFCRGSLLQRMHKDFAHYGLFVIPSGPDWKKHRKFLQPAFGPHHLRLSTEVAVEVTRSLTDLWDGLLKNALANGKKSITVNIHEAFSNLTLDVIGKVAFSYNFKSIELMNDAVAHKDMFLINEVFATVIKRFAVPPFLWSYFGLGEKDAQKSIKYINTILRDVIEKKRARMASPDAEEKSKWNLDLLDRLLDASKGGGEDFTDQEIMDEVFAFFLAGHETTANALTNVFWELSRRPDIMANIEHEINDVLGPDGEPNHENLASLKYVEQVVKETLRLHPVVSGIPREANKNVEIMGHHVPAGATVFVAIRQIHRDTRYWDRPLEFDPSRWDNGFNPRAGTYLPFGDGPMNCIGQKIAMIESKVAVIQLVRKYKFTLVQEQSFRIRSSITTGFKDGLFLEVSHK